MRDGDKHATGFVIVYAVVAGAALTPLFWVGGATNTTFSIALVTAVALIPVAAIISTMIVRWLIKDKPPVVPRELVGDVPIQHAGRQQFEFAFAAWNGIDSGEAVQRLSVYLRELGIEHRYARTISVRDGDTRWEVSPVAGQLRITGWVEAPGADERMMVMAAIEEFLIDELGIRLEKLAA